MYASSFGLKQEPFSIAPDPRYLFMSERHREALAHLLYGIGGGGGFVLLTGAIGAGKTTVCRCFLEQVPQRCNVAYIFNPKLTVAELLRSVCDEFGVPYRHDGAGPTTVKDYVDPLNEYLLRTHGVGQNNLLIIDEAQNLSADVLEQLRLLTNLETNERKLLQIILIGQPELREMLARPELEQLAQRVIARFHLQALSEPETVQYIAHRMSVAGLTGPVPFDFKAIHRIHALTRGVPRRINLLCDRALLGAYASGQARVSRGIVDKAASEVFGAGIAAPRPRAGAAVLPPMWMLATALAGAALVGAAVWALQGATGRPGVPLQARAAQAGKAASASVVAAASGSTGSMGSAGVAGAGASAVPGTGAASAAGAPASGASGSLAALPAAAAATADFDLLGAFGTLTRDEAAAWRELAALWGNPLAPGAPCVQAARAGLACDSRGSSLATIRLLDRPGFLTLRNERGQIAHALLIGLGAQTALLRIAGVEQPVSLQVLAGLWRGDFSTLWRTPPGYGLQPLDQPTGTAVRWLAGQLESLQGMPSGGATASGAARPGAAGNASAGASDAPVPGSADAASSAYTPPTLKARIFAFQAAQGLKPDGLAGPFTLMQLNRALGVDEPRLKTAP